METCETRANLAENLGGGHFVVSRKIIIQQLTAETNAVEP